MSRVKLDRIDLKILRELQTDGRMTNLELAKRVGISAPPCLRRVRALKKAGYILGYHADVAPDMLGFGITAFVAVELTNHSEADFDRFVAVAEGWPNVRECHMLTGDADFLLKVVAKDLDAFQKFITSQLASAQNVHHVKSSLAMKRAKCEYGVPLDEAISTMSEKRKTGRGAGT